jgi:hypothetical protein
MPIFLARWPDGSFSLVDAYDEQSAFVLLDELGDEPAELRLMENCLVDFDLTDSGAFRLRQFGEETWEQILDSYPSLNAALKSGELDDHNIVDDARGIDEYSASAKETLAKAVQAERERFKSFEPSPASTEIGKALQGQLGGSGHYVDALVEMVAEERLLEDDDNDHGEPN